jgi:hypothetical protein
MINDLGFPLENFDAAGRFRKMEKDRPIVSNGSYIDRSGSEVDFAGSRSLAKFLVDAPEVHEAFVEQLFQYEVKQPIRAFGPNRIQDLSKSFEKNNCNINRLIREITVSSALGVRELSPPPAAVTATP